MELEPWTSLPAMFYAQAERLGDAPFMWAKKGGTFEPISWAETARQAIALAKGLAALGIEPGDRVALVSENKPEWAIADLAIMSAGALTVPAYTTNTVRDHAHIFNDSGAKAVILSSKALASRVLPAAADAPSVRFVVAMEDMESGALDIKIESWNKLIAGGPAAGADVTSIIEGLTRADTACLIYTSGTSGTPRGVMLSHEAMLSNCEGAYEVLLPVGLGNDVFLSFLPLSHAFEHTAGLYFPIFLGAQIYYAERVETLTADMVEARPTIMLSVPRLYEMIHQRISAMMERDGGIKATFFNATLKLGRNAYEGKGRFNPLGRLANLALTPIVRRQIRARFGGKVKALISGGAPLNPDIAIFFNALGVRLLQGYGQTEAGPVIGVGLPLAPKHHTVGPALKGIDIRIAEDGEILARGPMVMKGYWGDEGGTARALRDGWLHTGDIGFLDEDGYIQITDRKKDIIVLSGGDNLAPQRVEGILTMHPDIDQALVYGDKHAYVVAMLVPDKDFLKGWADKHGKPHDLSILADDPDFKDALGATVKHANSELSPIESIRRYAVAPEPFTQENDMLTPTLKTRRHVVLGKYRDRLEALYGPPLY